MDNEKVIQVVRGYVTQLDHRIPIRNQDAATREEQENHLLWMCRRILEFVEADRKEKAFRWLGFIQGALWCFNTYSIEEMKNHNRPEGA